MGEASTHGNLTLIGVDGGATEAKAHHVRCGDVRRPRDFALGTAAASREYERRPGFEPVSVTEQLRQRDAGEIDVGDGEREQAALWIEAACEAVADVVRQVGAGHVLIGVGMPGLKTPDGRGINALNNGPRMPDYLDRFERRLSELEITLAAPVAALGSDADYCGLGELHAEEGLFRDVDHAYYVGCGTGIADAMKLGGRLVTFDESRAWIQKSWQMPSSLGPTFEKLVSAKSLNDVYARLLGGLGPDRPRFPEVDAAGGDPTARAWLDCAACVLAELIFERMQTVFAGRADAPHRGESYAALQTTHRYLGTRLDRVVIGQRVGQIYADPAYRSVFADRLDAHLAVMVERSGRAALVAHCLENGRLKAGLMQASRLRAAPALGAAIAAAETLGRDR